MKGEYDVDDEKYMVDFERKEWEEGERTEKSDKKENNYSFNYNTNSSSKPETYNSTPAPPPPPQIKEEPTGWDDDYNKLNYDYGTNKAPANNTNAAANTTYGVYSGSDSNSAANTYYNADGTAYDPNTAYYGYDPNYYYSGYVYDPNTQQYYVDPNYAYYYQQYAEQNNTNASSAGNSQQSAPGYNSTPLSQTPAYNPPPPSQPAPPPAQQAPPPPSSQPSRPAPPSSSSANAPPKPKEPANKAKRYNFNDYNYNDTKDPLEETRKLWEQEGREDSKRGNPPPPPLI